MVGARAHTTISETATLLGKKTQTTTHDVSKEGLDFQGEETHFTISQTHTHTHT